jgi:FAD/FMN-containing dehydrogenase
VPLATELLAQITEVVGSEHVLEGDDLTAGFSVDWTGRYRGHTPAVVRPGDIDEVAAVLALCAEHGTPVVPQGGNTGLVGGGVPLGGEVVLSLRRLTSLAPVDTAARAVTAGAGVTIGELQRHAAAAGLEYAVDLASRDSATVGGTVATNAGGLRVVRFGATRAQLLGIEAVLSDGRVLRHLGGLTKDNTGYDLAGLLCGSEGTLAVVTAARLRLVAPRPQRTTALVAFASIGDAIDAAGAWAGAVEGVEAIEFMVSDGVGLVADRLGLARLVAAPAHLLVEAAGSADPTDALAAVVASTPGVLDVAVGRSAGQRERLWRYREGHTEAINQLGPPHKLDVTLPHDRLADFIDAVPSAVEALRPGASVWLFGHAGDGNVHVNVTGVAPDDPVVDDVVLHLVADLGGSISAEHGIGTAKRPWLGLNRSPEELSAFAAIKGALDQAGILNPNVLLP